jgi:outer membrane protein assembly factor BamA
MHSYKTLLILIAFLCNTAGPLSAESSSPDRVPSDLFGKIIQRIEFSSDLPLNRSHYDPYIGIKPGEELTRTGVKRAIQFLYESGRFFRC